MEKEKTVSRLRQDGKILVIAVVCGILAVLLLAVYLQEEEQVLQPILLAKEFIPVGGTISYDNVEIHERPVKYVSHRPITPMELRDMVTLTSSVPIEPGAQIVWSFIKSADEALSISDKTLKAEYDMRLVTISIDEIKGVGGYIEPNDMVDVLWTGADEQPSNNKPDLFTTVLLEGVTIAAVGSATPGGGYGGGVNSVTMKVSQREAAVLTYAEARGQIKLTLRHREVVPDSLLKDREKIEIGFQDIKESVTVSNSRRDWIRVRYGIQR